MRFFVRSFLQKYFSEDSFAAVVRTAFELNKEIASLSSTLNYDKKYAYDI